MCVYTSNMKTLEWLEDICLGFVWDENTILSDKGIIQHVVCSKLTTVMKCITCRILALARILARNRTLDMTGTGFLAVVPA